MDWTPYEQDKWNQQPLPPVRRWVLCHIAARQDPTMGLPVTVAVGYLRLAAGCEDSPVFTIPGVGGPVVAWSDCLGDEYQLKHPKNTW